MCTKIKYSIDPAPLIACTLTTDNLLTLANIITTSGLDHHPPPSLGVFTSVQVAMLYLQENIRQQALANIFGTSQPTISRAINTVLNILDIVLPPPPQPKDLLGPNGYTYSMARSCHAGGGRKPGTYTAGNIIGQDTTCKYSPTRQVKYSIFLKPLPGSTHDITAIRNTGLLSCMQPWHCTADKGYVGLGCDTPFKRRPGKPLLDWQKRFNKGINAIRYVVERSIAHLKVWRILSTPCRLPQPTTIRAINVIRKIMFYQPPTEPHFPSS